ncbi:MAG: hypothetical protein RR015_06945, partial [Bacteroidales bacterium]
IHFDGMAMVQGASMALPIYGLFIQKVYSDPTLGYTQTENFTVPTEYANPCQADVGGVVRQQQQQGRTSVQPDEIVEGIFD